MSELVKPGKNGSRNLNKLFAKATGVAAGGAVATNTLGGVMKTELRFSSTAFALVDEPGVIAYVGKKIFDFPAGVINIYGAVANLTILKSSAGVNADFDGDFGVGTTTAGNNAALATTEQDVIPTTATPQAVAGATTAKGKSAAAPVQFDGTTTPIDLYLNFLVDDADHNVAGTPCNLLVSGTLTLLWAPLGDY